MTKPLLNIAIAAARQAGDIILRQSENVEHMKISEKSSGDFFCEVDVKAEQAIMHSILKAYPDHGFIAEESGTYNPQAEVQWIIDPLDGTNNYLHGFPFFSISIACKIKNQIEHAVVYDPLRHEYFHCSRGAGAKLNDRRIRVSKRTQINGSILSAGFPSRRKDLIPQFLPTWNTLIETCAGLRRTGSAALDLAYVASGRLDGVWLAGFHAWDIAAGSLLIKEAGGMISAHDGDSDYLQKGEIIAANPKIHKQLLQLVQN